MANSPGCGVGRTLPGRGQARAAEDAEEIRFADVEALAVGAWRGCRPGWSLGGGARRPVRWIASRFGEVLRPGPDGGEEGVDVGVASEVADDGSDGADMEMKSLGELVGGCGFVEVSAADLVATLGRGIGLLEQAREFLGASHRCWVPNRQVIWPRGTPWERFDPRGRGSRRPEKSKKCRVFGGAAVR